MTQLKLATVPDSDSEPASASEVRVPVRVRVPRRPGVTVTGDVIILLLLLLYIGAATQATSGGSICQAETRR